MRKTSLSSTKTVDSQQICLHRKSCNQSASMSPPPKPKRPAPSYVMWMNVQGRHRIKMEHPNYNVPQVGKRAGEIWRMMDEMEKENWKLQASIAMNMYKKDFAIWKCLRIKQRR